MQQHATACHRVFSGSTEMLLVSDRAMPIVRAELRYRGADPLAVQMLLAVDQTPPVCWTFGRDLLISGLSMPSGMGDVHVYPADDGVIIELRSATASAVLLAHRPDIQRFLARTVSLVPPGTEGDIYDLATELAAIPVHDAFEA